MQTQKKSVTGIIVTLLGGTFWGLSGACGQYLFETKEVSSNWLVPIRLTSAGLIALIYFLCKDRKKLFQVFQTKRNAIDIILYGIGGMMLCQYTYFATIERSNAGIATILQYISPVIILIVVCFMEKKLPKAMEILAILCALGGIFLIATHGNIKQLVISKEAFVMGICCALATVFFNMQPKRLMEQFSTLYLIAWAMLIGGGVLTVLFRPWNYSPLIDFGTIATLLVIILVGTIGAFSFYMQGVKLIGPAKASLYACVEPVSATVLSVFWLKAPFWFIDFLGFVCILAAMVLLSFPATKKE